MNQNRLKLILGIATGLLLVLAILLFVASFAWAEGVATRIVMIISAVLSLVMAALLFYLFLLASDAVPNFFLYDNQQKRNLPAAKLNFDMINIKMNRYLSRYAKSEGKLWTDRVLEASDLDMDDVFKPLVAYKLFYDLAAYDTDNGWKCFEYASEETVEFLCDAMVMNNDKEMAQTIRQMKSGLNGIVKNDMNMKCMKDYIISNRPYLKKRMELYVRENIEQFNHTV